MHLRSPAVAVAAALLMLAGILTGCGSEGSSASDDTVTCSYPDDGRIAAKEVDPPPARPGESGPVRVQISTDVGPIVASLDADAAPCTVNSFLSLARQGYFDDTPCHRLTTPPGSISVLQCGDPTGTGTGGPGYSFADELSGKEIYGAGTLAMANAGPDTNGSQFFMVYGDSTLEPQFTVFGRLDDDSVAHLADLAAKGTADGSPDGAPAETVGIQGVEVVG